MNERIESSHRHPHRHSRMLLGLVVVMITQPMHMAWAADQPTGKPMWQQSGDILQWGIPLIGLGLSFVLNSDGDWSFGGGAQSLTSPALDASSSYSPSFGWPGPDLNGSPRHDFAVSFVRMEVATYALKYAVNAKRPNGGSQSFPSGHTAAAFMGAEFIRKEYGPWWGLPAYGAASWVGYTRVKSHNHYWRDVIGGAALGVLSNYDFGSIKTKNGTLSFTPTLMMPSETTWARPDPLDTTPISNLNALPVPGIQLSWTF
ncbi:phosphatase PAP2 family protein [Stenotrophobium rhamnosiphilum]|nr:phosphatase PAP2 family protein [Stenotrophobium rhamnosiphilum]